MAFSRLPYNFEEALAEVKSWRASYKPDYNTEAVLVEEMQRMAKRILELEALQYLLAQQRTWVGLTKDEVEILAYKAEGNTWIAVELTETKLKEKNK